jgi:hypothetical protein
MWGKYGVVGSLPPLLRNGDVTSRPRIGDLDRPIPPPRLLDAPGVRGRDESTSSAEFWACCAASLSSRISWVSSEKTLWGEGIRKDLST